MTFEGADDRCDRIAASGHGIVTRREALDAGHTEKSLRTRIRSGRLLVVHPGVFLARSFAPTGLTHLAAAIRWSEQGVASHRSAGGLLYELDGVPDHVVEISTHKTGRRPGVVVHRLRPEDRPRRRSVNGIPTTTVERTLRDLASVLPPHRTGLAIDDALRRRLTVLERLRRENEDPLYAGCRGRRAFDLLLRLRDERDEKVRSRAETSLLRILKKITIERVEADHRVEYGGGSYYLDLAFPRRRVGVELHGLRWHFGEAKWKRDLARNRHLTLMGWTMLYFSRDDPLFRPQVVQTEVTDLLLAAAPTSDLVTP